MIDVLYFNSLKPKIDNIYGSFEEYGCNVMEVDNTYDVFKEISCKRYDAIITASNFEDIDLKLYVRLLKKFSKYTKIVILHNLKVDLEKGLYNLDIDNIIDYNSNEDILALKMGKIIREIIMELNKKVFDVESDIVVDLENCVVKKNSITIKLSIIEFDLLKYLIVNKNIVLSRKEIERAVWGNNISDFDSRVIDVYILKLRRKLDIKCIETIRGIGYSWKTS